MGGIPSQQLPDSEVKIVWQALATQGPLRRADVMPLLEALQSDDLHVPAAPPRTPKLLPAPRYHASLPGHHMVPQRSPPSLLRKLPPSPVHAEQKKLGQQEEQQDEVNAGVRLSSLEKWSSSQLFGILKNRRMWGGEHVLHRDMGWLAPRDLFEETDSEVQTV